MAQTTTHISNYSPKRVHVTRGGTVRQDIKAFLADNLEEVMQPGLVGLKGTMYATRTFEIPLSAEDIAANFGQEINYFSMQVQASRAETQQNNLISTSTVRTPFLVRAVAFVAFAEFEQGAVAGGAFPAPDPDAPSATPAFTGAIPFGQGAARPSTFNHGWPVLEFLWAMMSAYRFQMFLGGDLRYVDELLRHMGTIEKSSARYCGYGQAQRGIADYIRLANDRMAQIGEGRRFLPITAETVDDANVGVLPPLVEMSIGGPCAEGVYGSCFPIKPFVAMPGVPIDMQLVRENADQLFYDAMVRALGVPSMITYDAGWTENLAGNVGYAGDFQFRYGRVQIGFILLGARLTSRCCVDWYYNYGSLLSGLYEHGDARRAMERMSHDVGLSGIPMPKNLAGAQRPLLSGIPDAHSNPSAFNEAIRSLVHGNSEEERRNKFIQAMEAGQANHKKAVLSGLGGIDL